MTRFGQYLIHDIAGSRELVGRDVIVVHRLLKNSVTDQTTLRGYALFTRACVEQFGLDPAALGMVEHTQAFEDIGEVTGYVMDLERRWRDEQQRQSVYIGPDRGITLAEFDLPAPSAVAWAYITSPAKRPLWQLDTRRVDQRNPRGVPGVGTTNHCVHGEFAVDEEILDWKPFAYFTERSTTPAGTALFTFELTPLGDGGRTRAAMRMLPDAGAEGIRAIEPMVPTLRDWSRHSGEALAKLLASVSHE